MEDKPQLPSAGQPLEPTSVPGGVSPAVGGGDQTTPVPVTAATQGTPASSATPGGGTWSSSVGGFTPAEPVPAAASGPDSVISSTGGDGYRPLGQIVSETSDPGAAPAAPPSSTPSAPAAPKIRRRLQLATRAKLIAGGVALAIVLVAAVGATLFLHSSGAKRDANLRNAKDYTVTSIPLASLSKSGQLSIDQAQQLDINGQLRINNSLVLSPSATPTNPSDGQIYLNNQNQQLYYFNGQVFIDLATGKEIGSVGRTTPGAGLTINNGQLNNTGVLSLQGQSGAVTLVSGGGVGINGLTISNTGVTGISGTSNQISVSQATGNITLALPQDIATGSAPTFAGISVPTLTARPGDTGLVIGANTQDLSLQGANTTISDTANGNTTQIVFATPTSNSTLIVPTGLGGTICTSSGNCQTSGAISLQPTSPGTQQVGNANISGTFIAGAFTGDGSNLSNVNAAKLGGQLPAYYLNASNINAGALAVNFGGTGATTAAGARANLGAAESGANSDINSLTALSSITPSSSLAIGATDQPLFLQGSSASTFSVSNAGSTTTLEFATPATDASIVLPNTSGTVAVKASGPLQLNSSGNLSCPNCLVSGGSGTAGVVSVNNFTGAITVAAGTGLNETNSSGLVTIAADQDISQSAAPTFAGLTLNGQLGVGVGSPAYPIDVSGDVNVSGTYRINGVSVCTTGGCTATGGSGNYIQNGTALQSANLAIQGVAASSPVALVRGTTGQSANIFVVQNATGTSLFAVTPNGRVGVATGSPNYPLDVNGDINTNGSLRVGGVAVCSSGTGCAPASGSSNYIQNGTSLQVANYAVQSASSGSSAGVLRGASAQTADILQVQANDGTELFGVGANGNGYVSGKLGVANNSPAYQLDVGGDVNTTGVYRIGGVAICTSSGCTANGGSGSYIQNGTTIQAANIAIQSQSASSVGEVVQGAASQSADIFDVQNAAGTNLFSVTPAGTSYVATSLGVGVLSPSYAADINGDVNITGSYRINGTAVCTALGCAAVGGSNSYIQNSTTLQAANFTIQSAAATNSPTAVIRQASGQTGDLIDLDSTSGSVVAAINPTGKARFGGATAFTSTLNLGTNTSNAAGGITFGSDTDLYRSAASTLKTDGTLQAGQFSQSSADFTTGLQLQSTSAGSTRSTNLTFTDNQATPQSISLRKEGNSLAVLDNSGNAQLAFSPGSASILFGSSLDTNLYRSAANSLTTDGALTVGGTFTNTGPSVFRAGTNGTSTFEIQNASNSNVFVADTQDRRVGIDTTTPPQYPLDVNGDVNTSGVYRVNGTQVCDSSGCTASPNSGYYIQNGTSVQSANYAIQSASASSVAALIEGAASQTANLFQLQTSSGSILDQINAAGALSVQSTTASGALNVGSNSSTTAGAGIYFGTDTNLYRSGSGALTTDGTFSVAGTINTNNKYLVNGSQIASTNLSDGANLAKLNATQTFAGASNTFSNVLYANGGINTTSGNLTIQGGSGTVSLGASTALTANGAVNLSSGGSGQLTLTSATGTIGTGSAISSTNTITGTTLDGTTGINTGASGGTQRIDSSGNLSNIGNVTTTGNSTFTAGGSNGFTFKPGTDNATAFRLQNAAGSTNLLTADTTGAGALTFGVASTFSSTVAVNTLGGVAGTTNLCLNASNQIASCSSSSVASTLQAAYNNSTSPQIVLTSGNGGLVVQDAASTIGGNLLAVQSNGGGTTYLAVTTSGASVTGTLSVSGTINTNSNYLVNGTQIASSNLSDSSNLAKLNAANTFTNTNAFNDTSTTAFQIQNGSGAGNLFVADTANTKIGIGGAPSSSGATLQVTGNVSASTGLVLSGTNSTGYINHYYTVGSGGVTAGDVVTTNASAQVVDTTTARSPNVVGVAISTIGNGATDQVVTGGNYTVNAVGPIVIGDQLVTSTTSGRVVADNSATTGILGIALSALASGNGTVSVEIRPVNGQSTPIFSPQADSTTAFRIQNAARGTTVFNADTTNTSIGVAGASTTAGYALNVTGSINASGNVYANGTQLCTVTACGSSGLSSSFIQNGTTTQGANFNIQSANSSFVGGTIQGAAGQVADLLDLKNSGGTNVASFDASGNFATSGSATVTGTLTGNGATVLKDSSNSSTAFQIQNAAGTATLTSGTATGLLSPSAPTIAGSASGGTITAGTYYFALAATNGVGTTPAIASSPASVTTTGSTSSIAINWSAVTGATGYQLYYSINGTTWTAATSGLSSATTSFTYTTPGGFGSVIPGGSLPSVNTTAGSLSVNGTYQIGNVTVLSTPTPDTVFIGQGAGNATLTGNGNVGTGVSALAALTSGAFNSAYGYSALANVTSGSTNVGVGQLAGNHLTTGPNNVAVGTQALQAATNGSSNVAIGSQALWLDSSGSNNVAIGSNAGGGSGNATTANTTGTSNTYIGVSAMNANSNQLTLSTAIGADSAVGASNTLILGCVSGVNSCPTTTKVGIGTNYAPNALTVSPGTYTTGTIQQTTTAITGTGTTFTSGMTGGTIYYSDGTTATVTYVSATSLTSSLSKTVTAGSTYTIIYGGFNVTGTGTAYLQPTSDSTNAFKIQSAASASSVFNVDTTNSSVGIAGASTTAGYALNVTGNTNTSGNFYVNGSQIASSNLSDSSNLAKLSTANTFTNTNAIQATSSSAFKVQAAGGASTLLAADTTNSVVGVGAAPTAGGDNLQVTGAVSATTQVDVGTAGGGALTNLTQTALVINGVQVCTISGCNAGASSGNYIQNGTAVQTANFALQSSAAGSVAAVIEGNATQSADILNVKDIVSGTPTNVFTVGNTGNVLVNPSTNSTTAFQVQGSGAGANLLVANTVNGKIGIGLVPSTTGATLQVNGSINTTSQFTVNGTALASTNLGDTADIAYLDSGPVPGNQQTFTGLNNFSAGANGFTPGTQFSGSGSVTTGTAGTVFRNSTNSLFALQVQNSSQLGSSTSTATLLNADTVNQRIGVDVTYTPLVTPVVVSAALDTTAGTLSTARTYSYQITAVDALGGETSPAAFSGVYTPISTKKSVKLTWKPVTGAVSYRIYRSQTAGTGGSYSTVGTVSGANLFYIDSDGSTGNGATPPSVAAAYTTSNSSNGNLQLSVGGNGTPTGQLYVSGTVPSSAVGNVSTSAASGVYVQGRYAYVAVTGTGQLQIFDVSTPSNPTSVGTVSTGSSSSPQQVSVQGRYAYVVCSQSNNLQIIDISNPAAPVVVGTVTTGSGPRYLYVQGRYAYVSNNGASTVQVLDISNPSAPILLSSVTVSGGPQGIYVQGRYAYTVSFTSGTLQIIDISSPAAPVNVGSVNTGSSPKAVYVQGRYAYVTNSGASTLQVIDVSTPSSPVSLGTAPTSSSAAGVYVQGRYAYVTNTTTGALQIFDMGGSYTQQLEAGGTETGTLQVDSNASIGGDENIQGGLGIGANLQVGGNAGINGSLSLTATSGITAPVPTLGTQTTAGTLAAATYYYKLAATTANGTTAAVASSPASITTTGSTSLNGLAWTGVTGATGYILYRSTDNITWYSNLVSSSTLAYSDDGSKSWTNVATPPTATTTGGNLTVGGTAKFNGSGDSSTGAAGAGVLIQNTADSTNAFEIQNAAGTSNLFIADTTNGRVGIGGAPAASGITLQVTGNISSTTGQLDSSKFVLNNAGATVGRFAKQATAGTGGVSSGDVVVMNSSFAVVDTTTARDSRVYGVATAAAASGVGVEVAIGGNVTVNVDTGAVNIGDQLVTSATSGKATVDNNATTGIIGIAASAKAGGSAGTVGVSIRVVNGQYAPTFRPSTDGAGIFNIQTAGGANILTVDSSLNKLTVTNLVITASLTVNGHIITGNSSGTTTAAVAPAAGSGGSPTCTISGNDTGGQITLTTGTGGWAAGTQCTITFANSYSTAAPHPVITVANSTDISVVKPYVDVPGSTPFTTFTLNFLAADSAQHTYKFNYFNAQ